MKRKVRGARIYEGFLIFIIMDFLEKDLEDIIYDVDNELLKERGLDLFVNKLRQVNIKPYGIADIVTYKRHKGALYIEIVELKRKEVNSKTFEQALGYAKGIQRYLESREFSFPVRFYIVLIGYQLNSKDNFCYISDLIPNVSIYNYSINFDGLNFEREGGYYNANEEFDLRSGKPTVCGENSQDETDHEYIFQFGESFMSIYRGLPCYEDIKSEVLISKLGEVWSSYRSIYKRLNDKRLFTKQSQGIYRKVIKELHLEQQEVKPTPHWSNL